MQTSYSPYFAANPIPNLPSFSLHIITHPYMLIFTLAGPFKNNISKSPHPFLIIFQLFLQIPCPLFISFKKQRQHKQNSEKKKKKILVLLQNCTPVVKINGPLLLHAKVPSQLSNNSKLCSERFFSEYTNYEKPPKYAFPPDIDKLIRKIIYNQVGIAYSVYPPA